MAFSAFTYGDPQISNPTLTATVAMIFGLVFGGGAAANYGWCG
jgi:hypothetical protein